MSIDETLDKLETGEYKYEPHYMSQSFFMGYPEDYDKVYDIKDTIKLLHILYKNREESSEIVPENLVVNLHVNMTHDQKHLGGFELEDEQINRVKILYETDYKRGWHGN